MPVETRSSSAPPVHSGAVSNAQPIGVLGFTPPMFTKLTRGAWRTFSDHLRAARYQIPSLQLQACLATNVRSVLTIRARQFLKDFKSLDDLEEDVLIGIIHRVIAPSTIDAALNLLTNVRCHQANSTAFLEFCDKFSELYLSFPEAVQPAFKLVFGAFATALRGKAPLFADRITTRLKGKPFRDWNTFYTFVLEMEMKHGALLFITPSGSHSESTLRSNSRKRRSRRSRRKKETSSSSRDTDSVSEDDSNSDSSSSASDSDQDSAESLSDCDTVDSKPLQMNVARIYTAPVTPDTQSETKSKAIHSFHSFEQVSPSPVPNCSKTQVPASSTAVEPCSNQIPLAPPMLPVQIQSQLSTQALLDSGAQVSMIRRATLENLPKDLYCIRKVPSRSIEFADASIGSSLSEEVDIQIAFKNGSASTSIQTSLYVVDTLSVPVILSHAFLSSQGLYHLLQLQPSIGKPHFDSGFSPPLPHG